MTDIEIERDLLDFINANEVVQTYRFLIYGLPEEHEVALLARGLFLQFLGKLEKGEALVVAEEISEERAVAFNWYRGAILTFAFATQEDLETIVKDTILDGLDYLRYKTEYLGAKEVTSDV